MSENQVPRAIETLCGGNRYRSRLEARYAVVFDEWGVVYEYEPEGYVLADGARYLPDFFVPAWDAFVEVKRAPHSDTDPEEWAWMREAYAKGRGLAAATEKMVVMCFGTPLHQESGLLVFEPSWESPGLGEFGACVRCGVLCIAGTGFQVALPRSTPFTRCEHAEGIHTSDLDNYVRRGLRAGRQARFEFGEKGR